MSADSTGYPRYIQYQGMKLGAFTVPQMRHIAATYIKLDECDSVATELVTERDGRHNIDLQTDSIIGAYQAQMRKDEAIFAAYEKQLSLNTDEMASMRRQAHLAAIKSKWLGCGIGIPVAGGISVGCFVLGASLKPKL